jgi:tRNA pseudouridine55 synthase
MLAGEDGRIEIAGILNVAKPLGVTSHDVVAIVRRQVQQRRVGHAGTLDPSAEGVLLVCLGTATRVSEYLMASTKSYRATVRFGATSTTDDSEGTMTPVQLDPTLTGAQIASVVSGFTGDLAQIPPAFAAIKLAGQPLYRRARAGEAVAVPPRPVRIDRIDVVEWQSPDLTIDVTCSKGTYIRALARDLGTAVGSGAYLLTLARRASGRFRIEDSIPLAAIGRAARGNFLDRLLYPVDAALAEWPALVLSPGDVSRARRGQAVPGPRGETGQMFRAYDANGCLVALLCYLDEAAAWRPAKVFPEEGVHDVA